LNCCCCYFRVRAHSAENKLGSGDNDTLRNIWNSSDTVHDHQSRLDNGHGVPIYLQVHLLWTVLCLLCGTEAMARRSTRGQTGHPARRYGDEGPGRWRKAAGDGRPRTAVVARTDSVEDARQHIGHQRRGVDEKIRRTTADVERMTLTFVWPDVNWFDLCSNLDLTYFSWRGENE